MTSKWHAKGLALRLTEEASKQNGHDYQNTRKGASPQTDGGGKQMEQTLLRKGTQLRLSSDLLRKQANGTDVTSKRHAKGLVLRLTEEACKRNRRDFEKAHKGACPQTD